MCVSLTADDAVADSRGRRQLLRSHRRCRPRWCASVVAGGVSRGSLLRRRCDAEVSRGQVRQRRRRAVGCVLGCVHCRLLLRRGLDVTGTRGVRQRDGVLPRWPPDAAAGAARRVCHRSERDGEQRDAAVSCWALLHRWCEGAVRRWELPCIDDDCASSCGSMLDALAGVFAAGRYGCSIRLSSSNCSGLCSAGYFCDVASESNVQHACGSESVFCVAGSATPSNVSAGHYSDGSSSPDRRTRQEPCPAGSYCDGGRRVRVRATVICSSVLFR